MRKHTGFILGALGFAAGLYLLSRSAPRKSIPAIHVTTADLDYKELGYEDLVAEDLVDLNVAEAPELLKLGLNQAAVDRVIENRPYRSKLELVSRLILSEREYAAIRDRIGVAQGRDPIKVAG